MNRVRCRRMRNSSRAKAGFTKPDEAKKFVEETGVDWLSVSIGSVHGAILPATKNQAKIQAKLDIDQLKLLKDATGIPLVLHGGSGIEMSYIRPRSKMVLSR